MVDSEQRKVNKRPFRLGDQLHRVCIIHGELGQAAESSTSSFPHPWIKLTESEREREREHAKRGRMYICISNHCAAMAITLGFLFWIVAALFRIVWKIHRWTQTVLLFSIIFKCGHRAPNIRGRKASNDFRIIEILYVPFTQSSF